MYGFQGKCTCCVGKASRYAEPEFDDIEHHDVCQTVYPFSFTLKIFIIIIYQ